MIKEALIDEEAEGTGNSDAGKKRIAIVRVNSVVNILVSYQHGHHYCLKDRKCAAVRISDE